MKAGRSASGSGRVVERDLADGLGAADLAPDLVALLLAQGAEVVVDRGARPAASTTGQTSSCSTFIVQPQSRLATPERARQRVGRRVAAAEAAEVDGVPRVRVARVAAVRAGSRRARRRRPAGRRGARAASRSRRGSEAPKNTALASGGTAVSARAVLVADRRPQLDVAGLHLVAVHQRDDARRAGVVRPRVRRDDDERLLVRVRAVARPTTRDGRPSARTGSTRGSRRRGASQSAGSMESNGRRTARSAGKATGAVESPMAGGQRGSPVREVGDTLASIAPEPETVAGATGSTRRRAAAASSAPQGSGSRARSGRSGGGGGSTRAAAGRR